MKDEITDYPKRVEGKSGEHRFKRKVNTADDFL